MSNIACYDASAAFVRNTKVPPSAQCAIYIPSLSLCLLLDILLSASLLRLSIIVLQLLFLPSKF